jgi:hypothetical protein
LRHPLRQGNEGPLKLLRKCYTPDASGNGNHGTLSGEAAIADAGRYDKALALDGAGDEVDIAVNAAPGSGIIRNASGNPRRVRS